MKLLLSELGKSSHKARLCPNFIHTLHRYFTARWRCSKDGANLATFRTEQEYNAVKSFFGEGVSVQRRRIFDAFLVDLRTNFASNVDCGGKHIFNHFFIQLTRILFAALGETWVGLYNPREKRCEDDTCDGELTWADDSSAFAWQAYYTGGIRWVENSNWSGRANLPDGPVLVLAQVQQRRQVRPREGVWHGRRPELLGEGVLPLRSALRINKITCC